MNWVGLDWTGLSLSVLDWAGLIRWKFDDMDYEVI